MLPHHTKLTKYIFFAFLLVILLYTYFEAQNLLFGPQIFLGTQSSITVKTERIDIKGSVKNVSFLSLDGRPLLVDSTGAFDEVMLLAKGLNIFTFSAQDRFGRTSEKKLRVFYSPTDKPTNKIAPTKITAGEQTKRESAKIQK